MEKFKGLSSEEVKKKIEEFGKNEFFYYEKKSFINFFVEALGGIQAQIYIFLLASLVLISVNFLIGAICLVLILVTIIFDLRDDFEIAKKIEKISKYSAKTIVIRDGKKEEIDFSDVVPGDVVFLRAGCMVPADGFVIEGSGSVDESIFQRGIKKKRAISEIERKEIAAFKKEDPSILFAGSFLLDGEIYMKVEKTGRNTTLSKVEIPQTKREEIKGIEKFVEEINPVIYVFSAVVFFALVFRGNDAIFSFAIASAAAVAGIPYYIYTVAQFLFFSSVERVSGFVYVRSDSLLGKISKVNIICMEKARILTGEKVVRKIFMNKKDIIVTGEGCNPFGDFLYENKRIIDKDTEFLGEICAISSFSEVRKKEDFYKFVGGEIENALKVLALKQKIEKLKFAEEIEKLKRKRREENGIFYTLVKEKRMITIFGDAFKVLKKCKKIYEDGEEVSIEKSKKKIENKIIEFAADGFLPFGIGYKRKGGEYVFLAVLGICDQPKEEAKEMIKKLEEMGIEVIILTSESETTAVQLARELGLLKKGKRACLGEEVKNLSEREREKLLQNCVVIARATDKEKEIVIKTLKKRGKVLFIESISTNPTAIKSADCSMAVDSSNDIIKFNSDGVLKEDRLEGLLKTIEESKTYMENLKKAVYSIFTLDFSILFYILATSAIYGQTLNPIMILAINMVADIFSGLCIPSTSTARIQIVREEVREEKRKESERKKEEKGEERIVNIKELTFSFFICVYISVASLIINDPSFGAAALIFSFIFISLSYINMKKSIIESFDLRNLEVGLALAIFLIFVLFFPMASVIGIKQITVRELIISLGIGLSVLLIFEIKKFFKL